MGGLTGVTHVLFFAPPNFIISLKVCSKWSHGLRFYFKVSWIYFNPLGKQVGGSMCVRASRKPKGSRCPRQKMEATWSALGMLVSGCRTKGFLSVNSAATSGQLWGCRRHFSQGLSIGLFLKILETVCSSNISLMIKNCKPFLRLTVNQWLRSGNSCKVSWVIYFHFSLLLCLELELSQSLFQLKELQYWAQITAK